MDLFVPDMPSIDPAANLALEEALVRAIPPVPLLRIWQNEACVVLGRGQRPASARRTWRRAPPAGVPVLRRASGGGAVYHDLGNLNITMAVPGWVPGLAGDLAALVAGVLRRLGLAPSADERGVFAGLVKVSGLASQLTRDGDAGARHAAGHDPGRPRAGLPRARPAGRSSAGFQASPVLPLCELRRWRRRRPPPGAGRSGVSATARCTQAASAAEMGWQERLLTQRYGSGTWHRQACASRGRGGAMDDKTRLELYRVMVLSRTFEEAMLREYHADKKPAFDIGAGLVPGEMHLSAGQEPVAAGVCAHLRSDDAVTATHRPHHIAIAHGVDLDQMTAEIFGREGGLGRGRGGHMHLFDPAVHFSCSGIIAEGLPPALGQAFAFQRPRQRCGRRRVHRRGRGQPGRLPRVAQPGRAVEAARGLRGGGQRLGDLGAAGRVHGHRLQRRPGAAYGIPGQRIEDNDVEAIYTAAGDAVARARAGEGPTLLEVHTLRMWGHFEGDPQAYRPDLAEVPGRDPIPAYEALLTEAGVLDAATMSAIRAEASARVEKAIEFAKSSPVPAPETARDYVFA